MACRQLRDVWPWAPGAIHPIPTIKGLFQMRPIYQVDLEMCGGEHLPPEFDLEEFCEVLQGKVPDIEVVATSDS